MKKLFSHRDDLTLANPLGPTARGWEQVAATIEPGASNIRDGEDLRCGTVAKCVTAELTYTVGIERVKAKVGEREDFAQTALRVTMIFRPEDGEWKVVQRHADPITTAQPAESVIQE